MLKKTSIITGIVLVSLCLLVCITLVSGLYYIESQPGTQLLQNKINARIPGNLTWKSLTLSPTGGILKITDAALISADNKPVAAFKQLRLSLDLSALLNGELVIKEFFIDTPTLVIEKNSNNTLNIINALTDVPPSPSTTPPEPNAPPRIPAV